MSKTIGIVGCGKISGIYLDNLGGKFRDVGIKACADMLPERAAQCAAGRPGLVAMSVPELLADPDIELVLNLTIPAAHFTVARQALAAGKHVYGEKPLTIAREEAVELLQLANATGCRVGCAPDTFLGGALQTCRQLIDSGAIGEPVACSAFMMSKGHEHWHPDPAFYYQRGGGPLFDMGPYYLTALVSLLGPVRRVSASTRITFPERVVSSEPKRGERIKVEVPTHVSGTLEFADGAIGTLVMSFDLPGGSGLRNIEINGTEGSLSVPDPNNFGGEVRLRRASGGDWESVPLSRGYQDNWRGVGPADLVLAARRQRPHRASGELAFHVLDIMTALHASAEAGKHLSVGSTCARPAALPAGLADGELD